MVRPGTRSMACTASSIARDFQASRAHQPAMSMDEKPPPRAGSKKQRQGRRNVGWIKSGDRTLSGPGFNARALRAAGALESLGVRKGDGVALYLRNELACFEASLAFEINPVSTRIDGISGDLSTINPACSTRCLCNGVTRPMLLRTF